MRDSVRQCLSPIISAYVDEPFSSESEESGLSFYEIESSFEIEPTNESGNESGYETRNNNETEIRNEATNDSGNTSVQVTNHESLDNLNVTNGLSTDMELDLDKSLSDNYKIVSMDICSTSKSLDNVNVTNGLSTDMELDLDKSLSDNYKIVSMDICSTSMADRSTPPSSSTTSPMEQISINSPIISPSLANHIVSNPCPVCREIAAVDKFKQYTNLISKCPNNIMIQ